MVSGCPEVDLGDDIVDLENHTMEMLQNIVKLRNLKTLIIRGGFGVPTAFPSALQKLILRRVDIDEFPLQICDLPNLEYLEISLTLIESIPREIGRLRGLKQLDLARNAILDIAPELWSLDGVENLELSSNVRVHIPAEVANMRGLRRIILRDIDDIQIDPIITTLNADIIIGLPNANLHPDIVAVIERYGDDIRQQIMRGDDQDEIQEEIEPFVFDDFPEDIPLSNDCSVCMEAQHLLILGCRHIVCVGCLNHIQVETCPVCRNEISRSLIKRKM
jgi:Leucine-rich repeat (LRR) protein